MRCSRVIGIVFLVLGASTGAMWLGGWYRSSQNNALCVHNLEQIGTALRVYAKESKDERFPLLSLTPGKLMFEEDAIYPAYLPDPACLVSPFHPDFETLHSQDRDPASLVDDGSYWYLGYIFANERSALAWIDEYKKVIPAGQLPANVNEIWPDYVDEIEKRDIEYRARYEEAAAAIRADWIRLGRTGEPPKPHRIGRTGPLLHERRLYYNLKEGVERFLITDIGNPAGSISAQSRIPVVIERPELHGDGGHVLFMDGHVEFVSYPGPFPMTEAFVEGLRSLDLADES